MPEIFMSASLEIIGAALVAIFFVADAVRRERQAVLRAVALKKPAAFKSGFRKN